MRLAWLIFFAAVIGSASTFAQGATADRQQPISIESLFPEQLPRGQSTSISIAIQSREMFRGAEVSPAAGVTVARVESLRPAEDSQGVAWWRVTIQVANDAAPGARTLALTTATGRTAPVPITIPAHVPTIANLSVQPHPQTIDVQFAMTDVSNDIGDKPYVWYSVDCGKDPIVGAVRGTVAAGMVHASLPTTGANQGRSGADLSGPRACALQLRASDKNGTDSNTVTAKVN